MSRFSYLLVLIFAASSAIAQSEDAVADLPVDKGSPLVAIIFMVLFVGSIVGLGVFMWWNEKSKKEGKKELFMGFKLPAMHKDTKPFLLGALVGAVLIGFIGFQMLGWKTGGASESLANRQAGGAVVAALAQICSAQFKSATNLPARLAELQKTERWSRGEVVAKAGFATMVGEKEPTQGVSDACAALLIPEKP